MFLGSNFHHLFVLSSRLTSFRLPWWFLWCASALWGLLLFTHSLLKFLLSPERRRFAPLSLCFKIGHSGTQDSLEELTSARHDIVWHGMWCTTVSLLWSNDSHWTDWKALIMSFNFFLNFLSCKMSQAHYVLT